MTILPLGLFERLINRYLRLDPELPELLKPLTGKVAAIEITTLRLTIYIAFLSDAITLQRDFAGDPDVLISGSPFDLMNMSFNNGQISASNVHINGSLELAQNIKNLFDRLDIDWEEQVAKVTGDPIAHGVGSFIRKGLAWGKEACAISKQNVTEYVQEEARCFPPREEIEDFLDDVDLLRNDVDRLEARIQRLMNLGSNA